MSTSSGASLRAALLAEMIRSRDQHSLALAGCIALLALSCRKDEDTNAPTVTILAPAEGFTLSVPGTIAVSAEVSDDNTVNSATISLSDADGVPIAPPAEVSVGAASATINGTLSVTSELILSGDYTLTVRASDGTNDGRAFRTVQVIEAPLRLRALFAVCTPGPGDIAVHRIDSAGNVSLFASFAQDLNDAAISSRDQRLFLAGATSGQLLAVNSTTGAVSWQIPNLNTLSIPWFTGCDLASDGRLYVGTNDGALRVFNASGGQQFSTAATSGYRPYLAHVQDDMILSEQAAIAAPDRALVIYTAFNGAPLDEQLLDKDLIAMHRRVQDRALLFGNRSGDGVIEDRTISTALSVDLVTFTGEEIKAVAPVNDNLYLIALPTRIVRYVVSSNSTSDLTAIGATDLAYDPANGILWAADGSTVLGIDPLNGSVVENHSVSQTIDHLLACFNR